jgi:hypothetical protein
LASSPLTMSLGCYGFQSLCDRYRKEPKGDSVPISRKRRKQSVCCSSKTVALGPQRGRAGLGRFRPKLRPSSQGDRVTKCRSRPDH